jgi:hypothetical protein
LTTIAEGYKAMQKIFFAGWGRRLLANLITFLMVALVLGATFVLMHVFSAQHEWTTYAQAIDVPRTVQAAEAIPIYPGARNLEKQSWSTGIPVAKTLFDVDASASDVASFYHAVLTRQGWTVEVKPTPSDGTTFLWGNQVDAPYSLMADLYIEPPRTSGSFVELFMYRVPRASKVPVYPGADHVTIEDVPDEYGMARTYSFVTGDSFAQLKAYYMSILPQAGWRFIESQASDSSLLFRYEDFVLLPGGVDGARGGHVTIQVEPASENRLQVQLQVRTLGLAWGP